MTTIDREQLLASAQDFADRALTAHRENDDRVVLMFAAISLEHLCKAYLYQINPALLTELKNGQLDSLLHLTGNGDKSRTATPRTISAREAVQRIKRIQPQVALPDDLINQLINVRDGMVHAGYLELPESRKIFAAYLRACHDLYRLLNVRSGSQWGRHQGLVSLIITQSVDEIERIVEAKFSAARSGVTKPALMFSKEQQEAIVDAILEGRVELGGYGMKSMTCPACQRKTASYIGRIDISSSATKNAGHPNAVTYVLRGEALICKSCKLALTGSWELEIAGVAKSVEYASTPGSDLVFYEETAGREMYIPYLDDPNFEYDRQFDPQVPYHPEDDDLEDVSADDESENRE